MDVDRLITAWLAWEAAPRSQSASNALCDAVVAAGLDGRLTHERVAELRRSGMSVPDAVQSVLNDAGSAR